VKEYPYWLDTIEPPAQSAAAAATDPRLPSSQAAAHQTLTLPARADVVVVGAGYTGLAAARHLASVGANVVVVERECVGFGASSRNAGQVLTGLRLDPATLVARYGERRARELFDAATESIARLEHVIASESIECEYARSGHIQAASKPSHFAAFREEHELLARVFDHRVELVSKADQRREVASDFYYGLLVDERSGRVNPARLVQGLAAAAVRRGACLITAVAVTGARRVAGRWIVSTTAGDIDAGDVFFATDAYTDGAAPALQRRLVPVGSYIIVTAPLATPDAAAILPRGRTAFDSKHFLHYFRLTADNRLLFGGRTEFSQPTSATTRRAAAILRRGMAMVFPQLAGVDVDYAWSGAVGFTRDQLPHAGKLDDAYYAAGYGGHGIAMAAHLGEQIARRIAGEPIDHPLFDDRVPAIPLYSGRPWFLPLVGAFYRVRDWIE
jgi:glycine/D-amino acid oxidase-like deaminating enzyme